MNSCTDNICNAPIEVCNFSIKISSISRVHIIWNAVRHTNIPYRVFVFLKWCRQVMQICPQTVAAATLLNRWDNTYHGLWASDSMTWWRHQVETFSALLALCAGNSTVTGEFPSQRSVTRSFDVFFDLRLDKRLSKQSWGWWFKTE